MKKLEGKVAIVTGGARGMGAEEVHQFVAEGAKVVVADINDEGGKAVADQHPGTAQFHHLDVRAADQWADMVAFAERAFGPVSVLVNNAGIVAWGGVRGMDEATFRELYEVNTVGVFLGMKAVADTMIRIGGGSIVNISSQAGIAGSTMAIGYTASKFAVRGITKSAALELGPFGIRVNSVHPGWIDTPMHDGPPGTKVAPIGRIGAPVDVARMVVHLASDEAGFISGAEIVVDGGQIAGYPELRPYDEVMERARQVVVKP
jgi:3alpha(or 20beta)-hydroxysteroid dehydrogenase